MRFSVLLAAALLLTSACGGRAPEKEDPLTLGQSCPQVGLSLLESKDGGLGDLRAAGQLSDRLAKLAKVSDARTQRTIRPLRVALDGLVNGEAGADQRVARAVSSLRVDCQDASSPAQ